MQDPRFRADQFRRQPRGLLLHSASEVARHERQQANLASVTSAKLGMLAVSAWGGRDSKVQLRDFLPFELEQASQTRMDGRTRAIARRLIRTGRLPLWASAILAGELRGTGHNSGS